MGSSRRLGLLFLAPAFVMVVLFFFAPTVLTGVFSFTTMSTSTGIYGGDYFVSEDALRRLAADGEPELAQQLTGTSYKIDAAGIEAVRTGEGGAALADEIAATLAGRHFADQREAERAIKDLNSRPRSIRALKAVVELFRRSVAGARFADKAGLYAAVEASGVSLNEAQKSALAEASWSGWHWTTQNFQRMATTPENARILFNTILYVGVTLALFHVGFAMVIAIASHYLSETASGIFRGIWLLPRITPSVLFVLLWKWLAWDTGFISRVAVLFGAAPRNWMLDTAAHAWVFVVLINGFVGASMGMLIFSSAIKAIPASLFHAAEVDGASRWQQIRFIMLPQLRWPVLFVACYQTLSLLASYEQILLSTDGGPGRVTEVWSLAAYHSALQNYAGNLLYGYGAALALVLVFIGVVASLLFLRLFRFKELVTQPRIEI